MPTKTKNHVENSKISKKKKCQVGFRMCKKYINKRKENNISLGKKISIILERRETHDALKFYCFNATQRKKLSLLYWLDW